ncbi:MAG: efflux transporter periplasmic adaptor subunit, partial [Candidatus Binataceae bacterium]
MFQPTTVSPLKAAASSTTAPRRRWLVLAAGAALVVMVGSGAAYWLSREPATTGQLTQAIGLGDLEDAVSALGTLQPLQYVDVGTQVSGQLKVLHVNYGEVVREGQLLAEIDPALYGARVSADEAQLLNLKAQVA